MRNSFLILSGHRLATDIHPPQESSILVYPPQGLLQLLLGYRTIGALQNRAKHRQLGIAPNHHLSIMARKAAAMGEPLPFAVVLGRLGGSAMTAAAVNALARPGI